MSKVLGPQNLLATKTNTNAAKGSAAKASPKSGCDSISIDYDDFTTSSSILEFLSQEQQCCTDDVDADSIFQEVSRLADDTDTRSVDEILREAEILIQQQFGAEPQPSGKQSGAGVVAAGSGGGLTNHKQQQQKQAKHQQNQQQQQQQHQQQQVQVQYIKMNAKYMRSIETPPPPLPNGYKTGTPSSVAVTPQTPSDSKPFEAFIENLPSVSVISEESTPKDMFTSSVFGRRGDDADDDEDATTAQLKGHCGSNDDEDDEVTDDATDATIEEITEGMETIELLAQDGEARRLDASPNGPPSEAASSSASVALPSYGSRAAHKASNGTGVESVTRRLSFDQHPGHGYMSQATVGASPSRRFPSAGGATHSSPSGSLERAVRRSSLNTTPDSGISSTPRQSYHAASLPGQSVGVNTSPKRMVSTLTSPIEPMINVSREHALKQEIERLQEKLKDTEERLQSLRIQHDSLSQLHRDLRESNTHLQEESEMLKLDVQHLNECANILRSELQAARTDRGEALELQKTLQQELEENRSDRKRVLEQKEKDTKVIQDLQRQCREMERILMRKHPDSVSALIVASKNPGKCSSNDQENVNSRKLLEQRIAQLEADAKEQDYKAQQILANVQARFNSVQSKYETHIADLETQVLSLQEINTKLNEKIESQVRTLDYFVAKKAERFYNNCTQTEDSLMEATSSPLPAAAAISAASLQGLCASTQTPQPKKPKTRDHSTNTIGSTATLSQPHSASSSTSSTANSTPNTSRPNSKQSGLRKPLVSISGALASKLPISQSDSTIAAHHQAAAKEDAHLLATIRGMRVDLAIKDKAMQRLTRELDECKKTIKKLQREKEVLKSERPHPSGPSTSRRAADPDQMPASTENQALREAQNKIKLLEADYRSLHDKRLQDLKTLQTAHERELASCHETVRILQQRLNERDEAYAVQKRRKMPVDYYALKAKVSSLERRHSEREERLHMLVEALSKGRLNGALGELLTDNNNQ